MKRSLLILLFFGQLGCNEVTQKTTSPLEWENIENHVIDSDFQKYLNLIPTMSLPYSTICSNDYIDLVEVDSELKSKYIVEEWEMPYRKIPSKGNFIVILYVVPADILKPIIRTYNLSGKMLSSQAIFDNYCGAQPGSIRNATLVIQPNLIISQIDSIWTYRMDSLENEIDGSRKLRVNKNEFSIQETGEIVRTLNN
jgi:hypothetical protein